MNNKIGIVTVTYNSGAVLNDFINSIKKQTHRDFILYVIDNNSTDNTTEQINNFNDDRVVYIQNDDNVGVAAANNQGIEQALNENCNFILLLNNDTVFASDTFEKLIKDLKKENADIIVPKMYYFDKKDYIWFAGGNFDKTFQCNVNHIGFREQDKGQYDTINQITYAPTCCFLMKKEVIENVGLMDEKYFVYEDDVDFCYRATIIANNKMIYSPNFEFYHKVGGLTNRERSEYKSDFAIQFSTRNRIYRCKKFFSIKTLFYIPIYFIGENIRILIQKKYKRSLTSFILFNKSFIKGLFY